MKIKVTDMTCGNCQSKIQKALISNRIFASIDLENKLITFNNEDDLKKGTDIIKGLGYTVLDA